MDELKVAYERYLEVFPKRWGLEATPKTFTEFPFYYDHAKFSKKYYEKKLCQGIMDSVAYFSMLVFDEYLGILHTPEERRDGLINGFGFRASSIHR